MYLHCQYFPFYGDRATPKASYRRKIKVLRDGIQGDNLTGELLLKLQDKFIHCLAYALDGQ